MATLNPFTADGFDMVSMTTAINKLPNLYGRLNEMNLFPFESINTLSVLVEQRNGTLNIVRSRPRGSAPDKNESDKRTVRSFQVPHFPIEDVLLPGDYQGVRAFGSATEMETQASIMLQKQTRMKNTLDQTLEYLRIGALQGIVYDADATVIYDLNNEFNIAATTTPETVGSKLTLAFALTTDTTDVRGKCISVVRHIEKNLRGENMSGVRCFCGNTFFDNLIAHPQVEKVYLGHLAAVEALGGDPRKGFRFGGITFENYAPSWTDHDGAARLGIAATSGICFPEGTRDTFSTIVAPGNFLETANTMGLPYYSRQEPKEFGQGIKVWAEGNWLPICKRPEVCVTVTNT
ncbi:MAG: major capsid protein [Acidobacteriales bacterium]|nr:major capsid protein [Terriglobales bacterium]